MNKETTLPELGMLETQQAKQSRRLELWSGRLTRIGEGKVKPVDILSRVKIGQVRKNIGERIDSLAERLQSTDSAIEELKERELQSSYEELAGQVDQIVKLKEEGYLSDADLELAQSELKVRQIKKESSGLSVQEAGALALLIKFHSGTTIKLRGEESFVFNVEPDILKICDNLIDQLPHDSNTNTEENREKYIPFRGKVIEKIQKLFDQNQVDEFLNHPDQTEDMKLLMIWLFNLTYGKNQGFIFNLLSQTPTIDFTQDKTRHVDGYKRVVEIFDLSEIPQDVRELSSHIVSPEPKITVAKAETLDQADPKVKERLYEFFIDISGKGISRPVTAERVIRKFPKLLSVILDDQLGRRFVRLVRETSSGRRLYDQPAIASLMYLEEKRNEFELGVFRNLNTLADEVYKQFLGDSTHVSEPSQKTKVVSIQEEELLTAGLDETVEAVIEQLASSVTDTETMTRKVSTPFAELEKIDPQVRQTIREYLLNISQNNSNGRLTAGQISQIYKNLTVGEIEKLSRRAKLRGGRSKNRGIAIYNNEDIVVFRYLRQHPLRSQTINILMDLAVEESSKLSKESTSSQ